MLATRDSGSIIHGPLPEDTARTSILVSMLTLSIYMSALVDLKALTMFKRRNTLYFWSLLVTSWGITAHSLGVILKWFVGSCPWQVHTAFSSFGWWGMVTGQSLVLYSRLHLVVRNGRVLRAVLLMIIVDFCLFQVPTTVQKFGSTETKVGIWLTVYHVYERIQLFVFTIQELIISVIYIRAAVIWLSPGDPEGTRHTKQFLIYLNILCIALDVVIVAEVFSNEWIYEEATQSLVYAIKLTLEFAVLNEVMEVYRLGPGGCTTCHRRVPSRSHHDPAKDGLSHISRRRSVVTRQRSSAQSYLPAPWPISKLKRSEGLRRCDDEESTERSSVTNDIGGLLARPNAASMMLEERNAGNRIMVTTGITTRFEGGECNDVQHAKL